MPSTLTKPLTLPGAPSHPLPRLIYGTAWKKEETNPLVYSALKTGFRALDTAAQPKHYREHHVASALRTADLEGVISRKDVFLQTKFSPPSCQDLNDKENLPYKVEERQEDESISQQISKQVRESVEHSLKLFTLGDEEGDSDGYIDCLILHEPYPVLDETIDAWTAMASFVPHRVRHLGISNCNLPLLQALCSPQGSGATLPKPAVVQNRLAEILGYDPELYEFCRQRGIVFQAFGTFKPNHNPALFESEPVETVAREAGVSKHVAMYGLLMGFENFAILDGTTKEEHMADDLAGVEIVGDWVDGEGRETWIKCLREFKKMMGCNL